MAARSLSNALPGIVLATLACANMPVRAEAYEQAVTAADGLALGTDVFNRGAKMEGTPTGFGLWLAEGPRLGAIDVMNELRWGKLPTDLAPTVEPLILEGKPELRRGQTVAVRAPAIDPEAGALRTRWVLPAEYATGGDFRAAPPLIDDALIDAQGLTVRVRMPREPGPYRLYFYALVGSGNAATANIPLRVEGKVRTRLPVDGQKEAKMRLSMRRPDGNE